MPEDKKCKHCKQSFSPTAWFQLFCSDACRNRAWRKKRKKAVKAAKEEA